MGEVLYTKEAKLDLSQIWHYSDDVWGEQQADRYYQMIITEISELAIGNTGGTSYRGVFKNLQGKKAGKHILFYSVDNLRILIVRILHERMDIPALLAQNDELELGTPETAD